MKLLHTVICLAICITLVLVSGCADTSFGTLKPTDFGTSSEEIKALEYYKQLYGEPGQPGDPRFLEPTLTTALDPRNLPVDSITSLSADSPDLYFWVFYDRFAKGDPVTITWTSLENNQIVLTETKSTGGVYGRVFAEFTKPTGNWPTGKHRITVTGRGTSADRTFEIVSGQTVTGARPFVADSSQPETKGSGRQPGWDMITNKPVSKDGTAGAAGGTVPPHSGGCTCPPMRSGGSWDGTWHHKNWGDMMEGAISMCQDGNSVTATYNLNDVQGRFSGRVSGDRLTGTWTELDSSGEVALTGRMVLVTAADGATWGGWFSYDPETVVTSGTYTWTGDRKVACAGSSQGNPGTFQTTAAPGIFGTNQPSGTLQVAPTRTQGSTLPNLSVAPSAWSGCWNVNSSPCGSTQVQLKPDGSSVHGHWCDDTMWLYANTAGIPLTGSWWVTSSGASDCCHSGYGKNYCDPACQLMNQLYHSAGNSGAFEFWYGTDGRSLEGMWEYSSGLITDEGTPLHGTPAACANELVLEHPSGTTPSPTDTYVVVQPDR